MDTSTPPAAISRLVDKATRPSTTFPFFTPPDVDEASAMFDPERLYAFDPALSDECEELCAEMESYSLPAYMYAAKVRDLFDEHLRQRFDEAHGTQDKCAAALMEILRAVDFDDISPANRATFGALDQLATRLAKARLMVEDSDGAPIERQPAD